MEVDEKPVEEYSDVGGLDKQIQELVEAVVLPMTHKDRFEAIGIQPPKGYPLFLLDVHLFLLSNEEKTVCVITIFVNKSLHTKKSHLLPLYNYIVNIHCRMFDVWTSRNRKDIVGPCVRRTVQSHFPKVGWSTARSGIVFVSFSFFISLASSVFFSLSILASNSLTTSPPLCE
jgi:hypothetical protein